MSTPEGSQRKYTPGPWFIRDHMLKENGEVMTNIGKLICPKCQKPVIDNPVNIQIVTKGWGIAQIGSYDPSAEHTQHLINARLITASPDLLEACQKASVAITAEKVLQASRGESVAVELGMAQQVLDAAISKARGWQPDGWAEAQAEGKP